MVKSPAKFRESGTSSIPLVSMGCLMLSCLCIGGSGYLKNMNQRTVCALITSFLPKTLHGCSPTYLASVHIQNVCLP